MLQVALELARRGVLRFEVEDSDFLVMMTEGLIEIGRLHIGVRMSTAGVFGLDR